MKDSSRQKIIFALVCVFTVAVTTIYLIMDRVFSRQLENDLHNRALEVIDVIDYIANTSSGSHALTHGITTLGASRDIKLIVVRLNEPPIVIASNKHALIGSSSDDIFANFTKSQEFNFDKAGNEFSAVAPISLENNINDGQVITGKVGLVFDTSKILQLATEQKLSTTIALVIMMLCALGVLHLITDKHIFVPLRVINKTLKKNFQNESFKPIPINTDDEIGSVAKTLNQLFHDLYESKKSLKDQKERYDLALQGSKVGLLDWNINNDILYCTTSVCEILGIEKTEIFEKSNWLFKRCHKDDKEFIYSTLIAHLKLDQAFDLECRLRHEDGHYIWVRAHGQAIRDKIGKAIRMVGYFVDISNLKSHEKLINSLYSISIDANTPLEKKINKIFKEALAFLKLEAAILCKIENDKYYVQHYECPSEYSLSKNSVYDLKDTHCSETIMKNKMLALHDVEHSYLRNITAHTQYGINTYIGMPLQHQGKIYGTVNFFDRKTKSKPFNEREKSFVRLISQWLGNEIIRSQYIESLRETEHYLEDVVSELTKSNAELENFVYVASHDLQEPLRMITTFGELLKTNNSKQLDENAKTYLGYMSHSASQMRGLIKGLLEYARANKDEEQIQDVDIYDIIEHVKYNLNKQIIESNAKIISGKLPVILANKASMISLLQNLVSNAIKFQSKDTQPIIKIDITENINEWKFKIIDNGIGIDPSYMNTIFEPFKRLHARTEYSGSGIGLAVCKKITERMNGKIWAEPNSGAGTTFIFTMPKPLTETGKAA